jgi:hypothetical protein
MRERANSLITADRALKVDQAAALGLSPLLPARPRSQSRSMPTPIALVVRQDGRIVAEHPHNYGRRETVYDPWRYVPVLARKPGSLRNGAPFKDWALPAALERVRRKLAGSEDGDRYWSPSCPPCSPIDYRRWKPLALRRCQRASIRPT